MKTHTPVRRLLHAFLAAVMLLASLAPPMISPTASANRSQPCVMAVQPADAVASLVTKTISLNPCDVRELRSTAEQLKLGRHLTSAGDSHQAAMQPDAIARLDADIVPASGSPSLITQHICLQI